MKKTIQCLIAYLVLCIGISTAFSQGLAPPSNVTAVDNP